MERLATEVCLPLGDMINHTAAGASVEVEYFEASQMMRFVTARAINPGEEQGTQYFIFAATYVM